MSDIATVQNKVQLGLETTPGVAGTVDRSFHSIGITPNLKAEIKKFRALGRKYLTNTVLEKEWSGAGIEGVADYNELTYLFASLLKNATPTGAGAAKTWVFNPSLVSADSVATYTVEHGSSDRAVRQRYGQVDSLVLEASRKSGFTISGSMFGYKIDDDITMTSSGVTELDKEPIAGGDIDVILADAYADLDTNTPLNRLFRTRLGIGNRFAQVWRLRSIDESYASVVELPPNIILSLTVAADDEGMAPLTLMRNNSLKYARILATGSEIETGVDYTLQIDLAMRVSEPKERKDEDGVYAIDWEFEAAESSAWGNVISVKLINTVASL